MKRIAFAALALLALGSCNKSDGKTHIYLQRFFGECGAEYGSSTDIAQGRRRVRHNHDNCRPLQRRESGHSH